jgi:hypothetical protein
MQGSSNGYQALSSTRSQPDSIQEYRTEYLIHAPLSSTAAFALFLSSHANGRRTVNVLAFFFSYDDEDQAGGRRDMQIGIRFHQEASKYINTINDMARGRKENLTKAATPRRR